MIEIANSRKHVYLSNDELCVLDQHLVVEWIHALGRNNQLQVVDQVLVLIPNVVLRRDGLLQELNDMLDEETLN